MVVNRTFWFEFGKWSSFGKGQLISSSLSRAYKLLWRGGLDDHEVQIRVESWPVHLPIQSQYHRYKNRIIQPPLGKGRHHSSNIMYIVYCRHLSSVNRCQCSELRQWGGLHQIIKPYLHFFSLGGGGGGGGGGHLGSITPNI